jgi:hypothetical protein
VFWSTPPSLCSASEPKCAEPDYAKPKQTDGLRFGLVP